MNLKPLGPACALGIDIGTSGVRAVAVDGEGRPVAASAIDWENRSVTARWVLPCAALASEWG